MIEDFIASIVDAARRRAFALLWFVLFLTVTAGLFVVQNFAITTNVTDLLDSKSAWRQNDIAFSKAFPQRDDLLVIVVDGKDSVSTEMAAEQIRQALQAKTDLFHTVKRPDANPYFQKNGLLLLSQDELAAATEQLIRAQPLLATLSTDPTLRGLFGMLSLLLDGVKGGATQAADVQPFFARVHTALAKALAAPENGGAWAYLLASPNPSKYELRRFVLAQPVLDYSALSPGAKASDFIRGFIKEKNLEKTLDVRVRLTGEVALSDEEFASISQGMGVGIAASLLLILLLLFLALRSWRLILPIFIVLITGLVLTTAFALIAVGSLNLISVAFAVMFTGIAVDFGIQFGVRYRDVRVGVPNLNAAMKRAGALVAVPLLLAALSTSAGFFSFTPTSYRGVAELGLIAGMGMLIAFCLNLTLLPALLRLTKPQPENQAIGYTWAAPLDHFLETKRRWVLGGFALLFVVALLACFNLRFDFDPLNLKDAKTESVSTMLELVDDPDSNPYTADVLAPSTEAAEQLAEKLRALPQVNRALTLLSLVPDNQDEKIALIADAENLLHRALNPEGQMPAPQPEEIKQVASMLQEKLKSMPALGGDAKNLNDDLQKIATLNDGQVVALSTAFKETVAQSIAQLKERLNPRKVDFTDIPGDLKSEWVAADGQARVEVAPKGNARDAKTLVAFVNALRKIAPLATGSPITIQESANTIKRAFVEAAIYSVIIIFFLLLLVLRKLIDTMFVLIPLLLASALTLGTASLIHLPINFANIIALPLLLGLGVSYSIYFVVYWRKGSIHPLQSSMAKAVLFSAATALVAFGSLSLSNHPGTASMGLVLTLSLFYVLFTTLFFLPALLSGGKIKSETKVSGS